MRIALSGRIAVLAVGLAVLVSGSRVRADEPEDALKAELLKFNKIKDEKEQLKAAATLIKDKEKAKKGIALAVKLQKAAKDDAKPFDFSGAFILGRAAGAIKEYEAAAYLLEYCAELATTAKKGEEIIQAYDALVTLYMVQKKYQEAVDVCERFAEMKGPREVEAIQPFFIERLVRAKAAQGKIDEALGIVAGLLKISDNAWYFLQLKGAVQREAGKYDEAIDTYQAVLEKLEEEKGIPAAQRDRFKNGVRYTLSSVYVDNKDIDKAAKQLQTLIKADPDNPTYKNDLGYIWADHDMNLEEAEKLIREALELDKKRQEKAKAEKKLDQIKESAAYLDSLGWVLFKQKKYKEALEPLKKAMADEEEGNHIEIWDHVGDCYLALGDKKAATDTWQKALELDDISRRDIERRKKIIAKLKEAGVEVKVPAKK